jgi:uncharacterized protein YgfB (UPF0149 family)
METSPQKTAPDFDLEALLDNADHEVVIRIADAIANWHDSLTSLIGTEDHDLVTALIGLNPAAQKILDSAPSFERTTSYVEITKKLSAEEIIEMQKKITVSANQLMKRLSHSTGALAA